MKNNKNARIEIRLPEDVKNRFLKLALQRHTTASELIYNFILTTLEAEENGKFN